MTSYPLNTSANVTLDNNGNGVAKAGPQAGVRGVLWHLTNVAVLTSTAVLAPVCQIFVGGQPTPDNFVDSTYTGNQDSTDRANGYTIQNGQYVFAVWTGGDAGAVATLSIYGTYESP
jgi:hypothetical protein